MSTSLLFSIASAGFLFTKRRDPGNEFVTKLDHRPLTFPGHAYGSGPIGRNQFLNDKGLEHHAEENWSSPEVVMWD